jgi:hypothetical protein
LVEDGVLRSLLARVAVEGEPWAAEFTGRDGRQLYATVSPVGGGGEEGLVAVIEEIEPSATVGESEAGVEPRAPLEDGESEE